MKTIQEYLDSTYLTQESKNFVEFIRVSSTKKTWGIKGRRIKNRWFP